MGALWWERGGGGKTHGFEAKAFSISVTVCDVAVYICWCMQLIEQLSSFVLQVIHCKGYISCSIKEHFLVSWETLHVRETDIFHTLYCALIYFVLRLQWRQRHRNVPALCTCKTYKSVFVPVWHFRHSHSILRKHCHRLLYSKSPAMILISSWLCKCIGFTLQIICFHCS